MLLNRQPLSSEHVSLTTGASPNKQSYSVRAALFGHKRGDFIGKGNGIIGHDAFQEQSLIVEQLAVILEVLAIFTSLMNGGQFSEQFMVRIDFQDPAGFEHGVIGGSKGLFHSQ